VTSGASGAEGWVCLPPGSSGRWLLPRAPRTIAKRSLRIHHPVTTRGRVGWETGKALASLGCFRLLPKITSLPAQVMQTVESRLKPGWSVAVARTSHPGRFIALLRAENGREGLVAKIATDDNGRRNLDREAGALASLGRLVPPPLFTPTLLDRDEGVLWLDEVSWLWRRQPWHLPDDVAYALGALFRAGAQGFSHGDCAPWNLLKAREGWVLLDWEDATEGAPPFSDLFHFLVQGYAHLGRPTLKTLMQGLRGRTWVGSSVAAYSQAARLRPEAAWQYFEPYLVESLQRMSPHCVGREAVVRARERLLKAVRTMEAELQFDLQAPDAQG
jgi:Phosphotransferase enzyme family